MWIIWSAHFFNLYLDYNLKRESMYSLDCVYYEKEFTSVSELINDVTASGMDPNYEITRYGKCTGEMLCDLIGY